MPATGMPKSLGEFLQRYEEKFPNDVVHIEKEVNAKWELSALCAKADKAYTSPPTFVFHKVRAVSGNVSPMPVVCNLFASRERCARAIGSTFEKFGTDLHFLKRKSADPVLVSNFEAPVKQVKKTGDEIDLLSLPVPVYHDWDAGPYISAGFLTCIDRASRADNCALQRGFIAGKREIRFYTTEQSHNNWILNDWEKAEESAPIAFWVGHDPAAYFGAQGKLAYPMSHYKAAGGVLGENMRLVPSETLGKDFLVPADAEIVIEGRVKFGERRPEGPFGECRGYTGAQRLSRFFEVTAVTQRRDAMWLGLMCGHKDFAAGMISNLEGQIYEKVSSTVPVSNVYMPPGGMGMIVYLSIKQSVNGQASEAIASSLIGTGMKHVFVFDEDIDIFDDSEVLFGLATRVQWDEDVHVYRNFQGDSTDPSTKTDGTTSKGGIDCTLPVEPGSFEKRNSIPKHVMDSIILDDYVSKPRLRKS
jgi:2,5-furandicarboxylate decarboxylase 1